MSKVPRLFKAATVAVVAFALAGCVVLPYGWGRGHHGHRGAHHSEQRAPQAYPPAPHDGGGYRGR